MVMRVADRLRNEGTYVPQSDRLFSGCPATRLL